MVNLETLYQSARSVYANAHAPYSRFHVAAAIRTTDGQVFCGCNVENLSFGATLCAERVAICNAITAGHKNFSDILILTDTPGPVPPCGLCRQVIAEFGRDIQVHSTTIEQGLNHVLSRSIQDLLPLALPQDLLERVAHETVP